MFDFYCKRTKNLPWQKVEVLEINEIRTYHSGKTKTIFKTKNMDNDKIYKSVVWSDLKLNIGDILQVKGWHKKDSFILVQILRIKRAEC